MNIPDKIKILGHGYDVRINQESRLGNGASGCVCSNMLRINMDPTVPESRQAETFLHEIFEALKFHLELDLEHKDLTALSEGLFAVLRDNELSFLKRGNSGQ